MLRDLNQRKGNRTGIMTISVAVVLTTNFQSLVRRLVPPRVLCQIQSSYYNYTFTDEPDLPSITNIGGPERSARWQTYTDRTKACFLTFLSLLGFLPNHGYHDIYLQQTTTDRMHVCL